MLHDEGWVGLDLGGRQPFELTILWVKDDGVESVSLSPSRRVSEDLLAGVSPKQEERLLLPGPDVVRDVWVGRHAGAV